jgi:hypothetical protein
MTTAVTTWPNWSKQQHGLTVFDVKSTLRKVHDPTLTDMGSWSEFCQLNLSPFSAKAVLSLTDRMFKRVRRASTFFIFGNHV